MANSYEYTCTFCRYVSSQQHSCIHISIYVTLWHTHTSCFPLYTVKVKITLLYTYTPQTSVIDPLPSSQHPTIKAWNVDGRVGEWVTCIMYIDRHHSEALQGMCVPLCTLLVWPWWCMHVEVGWIIWSQVLTDYLCQHGDRGIMRSTCRDVSTSKTYIIDRQLTRQLFHFAWE